MKIIKEGIANPKGFITNGVAAGIKEGRLDMGAIYSEVPAIVAGAFTKNLVKAAPVIWDKSVIDNFENSQLVIINAGVANASTGEQGKKDCINTSKIASKYFNIEKDNILLASTGVIGKNLPMDKIENGICLLSKSLNKDLISNDNFANSILTTDTKKKEISVEIKIHDKKITISGACKGSGMIHPNMCTMLSFITTDIKIEKNLLQKILIDIVDESFNMISVDGDTSTNDTILLLANGLAENELIDKEDEDCRIFKDALKFVCIFLAKKIAEDGEGATKLFEAKVINANNTNQARIIAKSVITSNLTKAALFGNDANWGRILCAMGYSGANFNPDIVDLTFVSNAGELLIVENGVATNYSEEKATDILSQKEVTALINLKTGNSTATAWGCDLTYDYVKINGDYRS